MPDLTSIRKQEAMEGYSVTYSDKVPVYDIAGRGTGKLIQVVSNEETN